MRTCLFLPLLGLAAEAASVIMTIAFFSHDVALLFCDTQAIWTDNADLYFCIQNLDESKKTSVRNCKADCDVYIPAVFSP